MTPWLYNKPEIIVGLCELSLYFSNPAEVFINALQRLKINPESVTELDDLIEFFFSDLIYKTKDFGNFSRKLPESIQIAARRKLRYLNNAADLDDLKVPPANHLEALKGNLRGFYSIRINKQ